MVNVSKIKKYNLEDRVINLRDAGFGLEEIVQTIKNENPNIHELSNLSMMSISRFLDTNKTDVALDKIKNDENPAEELRSEFRDKMYDLHKETEDIYKIMKSSLKKIVLEGDNYKTIKSAREIINAIEQSRKNWTSLIQFGSEESKHIEKAQEVNIIEVHNLLINVSKDLCPNCRRKIVGYVTTEENEE